MDHDFEWVVGTPLDNDARPSPRVSVIVPTFNRSEPLRALLQSLVSQRLAHGWFEVIIADDGSSGEVRSVAEEFASAFERLIMISGSNVGPGLARNRGASISAGAVLAFIDSDCLAEPGWLEALTSGSEHCNSLAYGPVTSPVPPIEPYIHSFQLFGEVVPGANFAISRRAFDALGGFTNTVSYLGEDHDFTVRAGARLGTPCFIASAVVSHPPRLKDVFFPWDHRPRKALAYRALRHLFTVSEQLRQEHAANNRLMALKALVKLSVLLALPLITGPSLWPYWPLGLMLFLGLAFWKRAHANAALRRAALPLTVSAANALRYGLLLPFADLILLGEHYRFGVLFFR